MEIIFGELMKNHTSFKIGGPCDEFCRATSEEEVKALIEYARKKNIPYTIMGNGSNLLVSDKGIRGLVIMLSKGFDDVQVDGTKMVCQSGILLSKLSNIALKNNLTGIEFASGIPGTLGGAIYMNAGAYGGEMKDIVKKVVYLENGEIFETNDLDFGYRHSIFTDSDKVILSAELELSFGKYDEIKAEMEELSRKRNEKQPLSQPSAGSAFKRPEGNFAGKLIEDAGLKGYRIGGAMVSEKHSGFIVNEGDATCCDVLELIEYIKRTVFEKFGVMLEPEVKAVGEM